MMMQMMQQFEFAFPEPVEHCLPSKVYKYLSPERSGVLQDWRFRFSQPNVLNDVFDMRPHIEFLAHEYLLMREASAIEEAAALYAILRAEHCEGKRPTIDEILTKIRGNDITSMSDEDERARTEMSEGVLRETDDALQRLGVLSLSEHPDSELLWAHYAIAHTGFAVEFDTSSLFFHQCFRDFSSEEKLYPGEFGHLHQVIYEDSRPSLSFSTMLLFGRALLVKSKRWSYEGEWRMFFPLDLSQHRIAVPGMPDIHLFRVPPSAISRVIIGAKASPELQRAICSLSEKQTTRHIKIQIARLSKSGFEMWFEDFPS
jgi:hypothetical protein